MYKNVFLKALSINLTWLSSIPAFLLQYSPSSALLVRTDVFLCEVNQLLADLNHSFPWQSKRGVVEQQRKSQRFSSILSNYSFCPVQYSFMGKDVIRDI